MDKNMHLPLDIIRADSRDTATFPVYTPENDLHELKLSQKFLLDHIPTQPEYIAELHSLWHESIDAMGFSTDYFDQHWPMVEHLLQNPGYYQMMLDYETWKSPSYFGYIVDMQTGQMAKSMEMAFGVGTRVDGERFIVSKDDVSYRIMLRLPAFVYFRERAIAVAEKLALIEAMLLPHGQKVAAELYQNPIRTISIGGGRFMEGRFTGWNPHFNHDIYIVENNPADNVFERPNFHFVCEDYVQFLMGGAFRGQAHAALLTGVVPYIQNEDDFVQRLGEVLDLLRFGGQLFVDDLLMTPCTTNGVMTQNWGKFAFATSPARMKPNTTLDDLENKFARALFIINSERKHRLFEIVDTTVLYGGTAQPYGALFTIRRAR